MTSTRIEEIQEQIQERKEKSTKAEGKLEDIETRLKDDFGVITIEEAEALSTKIEKEIKTLNKKEEDLESQIEDLLNKIENDDIGE